MQQNNPGGTVLTFYSYKGGTGRSMALANIAWILASRGNKVLVIDWDLEAPGLHRYFHPFLKDGLMKQTPGLINFVNNFMLEGIEINDKSKNPKWYYDYADLIDYSNPLDYRFPDYGAIDLISAGRQNSSYASLVNSFNWKNFYERGGGVFINHVFKEIKELYDYVLIDSRTGVSDTSGICTVQLPDYLIILATPNNQGIEGASSIASSVHELWQKGIDKNKRSLPRKIFPVLSRVDGDEKEKLDLARAYFKDRFNKFIDHIPKKDYYLGQVELPYYAYYGYEEILATFADKPNLTNSYLAAIERLTGFITDGKIKKLSPPDKSSPNRKEILKKFTRKLTESTNIFLSYHYKDHNIASELNQELRKEGLEAWSGKNIKPGALLKKEIEKRILDCNVFIPLISFNTINNKNDFVYHEWKLAEARILINKELGESFIIPITIDTTLKSDFNLPEGFKDIEWEEINKYKNIKDLVKNISRKINLL